MTPHGALIKDLRRWKLPYSQTTPGTFVVTVADEDFAWRYDDRNANIRALHAHLAAIWHQQAEPRLTLIAAGSEQHCRDAIAAWIAEHPMQDGETGEVLSRG